MSPIELIRRIIVTVLFKLAIFFVTSAFATDTIHLQDLKSLALQRYNLLSVKRQQLVVLDEEIKNLLRRRHPDLGFVLGVNSQFDHSKWTADALGFSYVKYRILDGGIFKKSQRLLESKKQLSQAELRHLEREIFLGIEQAYFQLVIFKNTLAEIESLQKRNHALERILRRMLRAGAANELISSAFNIVSNKIEITRKRLQEDVSDAEAALLKYVTRDELLRLALDLPKIEDILNRPAILADNKEVIDINHRAAETKAVLDSMPAIWLPDVSIEGRYGVMPLWERELNRRAEGAFLLTAEWSLASGLERRDEVAITNLKQDILNQEQTILRQNRTLDVDILKAKIKRHAENLNNISGHYAEVSKYARQIEKASEIGAISILEAKSTVEQLVDLILEISEEKMVLWRLVAEADFQLN